MEWLMSKVSLFIDPNLCMIYQSLDYSFYQEISIGDSIIKHKGFLDLILVKKTGHRKVYLFNCPSVMHESKLVRIPHTLEG